MGVHPVNLRDERRSVHFWSSGSGFSLRLDYVERFEAIALPSPSDVRMPVTRRGYAGFGDATSGMGIGMGSVFSFLFFRT